MKNALVRVKSLYSLQSCLNEIINCGIVLLGVHLCFIKPITSLFDL